MICEVLTCKYKHKKHADVTHFLKMSYDKKSRDLAFFDILRGLLYFLVGIYVIRV